MKRICLPTITLVVLAWAAIAWAQPQSLVGTVVAMRPDQRKPAEIEVRVDSSETKELAARVGQTLTVAIDKSFAWPAQVGLGDQVSADIEPAESGWTLKSVNRLGRGEFVNPGENPSLDLGSPSAKVLVKFFAPLYADCHRKTADLLRGIAEQEPDKVHLQIFDVSDRSNPAARQEMMRERLTCATVLVNNRYEFTLKRDGQERAVQLFHKPNEPNSSYNSEDALAVVQQEIARLYPPAKAAPTARPV